MKPSVWYIIYREVAMGLTGKSKTLRVAAIAALFIFLAWRAFAGAVTLEGAGATFPYPLYARWAAAYAKKTGIRVDYSAVGSGEGIKRIKEHRADFAASDIPLGREELEEAGLVQFPMVVGGVVPIINVDGVKGDFRLTPETLSGIFLGRIKKWNDPELAAANPGIRLPDSPIRVFHRSDASGTTWIFTDYLSKVSHVWRERVGRGAAVNWPAGDGRARNSGVAEAVASTGNSIGYTEYAYAAERWLKRPLLRNGAGTFVKPFINSFVSAARNADWDGVSRGEATLTGQAGKDSWPITGATFILLRKDPADCARTRAALGFFKWAYRYGADMAEENTYMPVPKPVFEKVEKLWAKKIRCAGEDE